MASHDIQNDLKKYWGVYFALLILTIITVAVSYLHVGIGLAVLIALIVATTKASMVGAFFMHLAHEKPIIYWLLIFTGIFFISMIALIVASQYSVFEGLEYVS